MPTPAPSLLSHAHALSRTLLSTSRERKKHKGVYSIWRNSSSRGGVTKRQKSQNASLFEIMRLLFFFDAQRRHAYGRLRPPHHLRVGNTTHTYHISPEPERRPHPCNAPTYHPPWTRTPRIWAKSDIATSHPPATPPGATHTLAPAAVTSCNVTKRLRGGGHPRVLTHGRASVPTQPPK